jgi:hypothetical protein
MRIALFWLVIAVVVFARIVFSERTSPETPRPAPAVQLGTPGALL